MSKSLDIYTVERRGGEVAFVTALWLVKRAVLTRYWLGDVRRRLVTRGAR